MGRPRRYTDDFYFEAAGRAWSAMRRGQSYTKRDILREAGLDPDATQHWPKLRLGFGRAGLGLSFDFSRQAWVKGTFADDGGLNALWNELERRWGPVMRREIVAELQNEGVATQIVGRLVEMGINPIAVATMLNMMADREGNSLALPAQVEAELIAETRALLPELPDTVRARLAQGFGGLDRIAGLLASPAG